MSGAVTAGTTPGAPTDRGRRPASRTGIRLPRLPRRFVPERPAPRPATARADRAA